MHCKRSANSLILLITNFILILALTLTSSCKNKAHEKADISTPAHDSKSFFTKPAEKVPSTTVNRMANAPTAFLRSLAKSPLPWQPWHPELLEHAERRQLPILAIAAFGLHARTHLFLKTLHENKELIDAYSKNYILTAIDLSIDPEIASLLYLLASEEGTKLNIPYLLCFTHKGDVITHYNFPNHLSPKLLVRSLKDVNYIIIKQWQEDQKYCIENSNLYQKGRLKRFRPQTSHLTGPLPWEQLSTSTRYLASLYDPLSKRIDSASRIPSEIIYFLSQASLHPATKSSTKELANKATTGTVSALLKSPMWDILEGSFFDNCIKNSWELPTPTKFNQSQSNLLSALSSISHQNSQTKIAANGLYLHLRNEQNTHGLCPQGETTTDIDNLLDFYYPTEEQIRATLSEAQFQTIKTYCNVTPRGNIPRKADARNSMKKRNTFALRKAPPAEKMGELVSAFQLLLKRRDTALKEHESALYEDSTPLSLQASLISSYSNFARYQGNPNALTRAKHLSNTIQEKYISKKGELYRLPILTSPPQAHLKASAKDHAILLSALESLYNLTLDPEHFLLAHKITKNLLANFADKEGYLREIPPERRILSQPIHLTALVFGSSTWGASYRPLRWFAQLKPQLPQLDTTIGSIESVIRTRLSSTGSAQRIITEPLFLDFLHASLAGPNPTLAILQGDSNTPSFKALHKSLLQQKFASIYLIHACPELAPYLPSPQPKTSKPSVSIWQKNEQIFFSSSPESLDKHLTEHLKKSTSTGK